MYTSNISIQQCTEDGVCVLEMGGTSNAVNIRKREKNGKY